MLVTGQGLSQQVELKRLQAPGLFHCTHFSHRLVRGLLWHPLLPSPPGAAGMQDLTLTLFSSPEWLSWLRSNQRLSS